jgi:hypothetical protein
MPRSELLTHAVGVWFTAWVLVLAWAAGGLR